MLGGRESMRASIAPASAKTAATESDKGSHAQRDPPRSSAGSARAIHFWSWGEAGRSTPSGARRPSEGGRQPPSKGREPPSEKGTTLIPPLSSSTA